MTPKCIEHAAGNPEKFRISAHVRLLEDRGIKNENDAYLKDFDDAKKEHGLKDQLLLLRTPGRMDFGFRFRSGCPTGEVPQLVTNEKGAKPTWFKFLNDLLLTDAVDRIQTNIGLDENAID